MTVLTIDENNALYYEHTPAGSDDNVTFVFFNPLTGSTEMWNTSVIPQLQAQGHGTLVYNMRGQADSPYSAELSLDQSLIVDDAMRIVNHCAPTRPVFVGLSIGGLYAASAALAGATCERLVLINTLRRDGPRLQWINDAVVRLAETGGPMLMRDVMSPLIMNEGWLADNRNTALGQEKYEPLDSSTGTYNLLSSARSSDWNVPYEKLTMPVLCITGLHDRVFRDPRDIDTLLSRFPDATHVEMENAGHMVPVEQPEALKHLLIEFVSD